MCGVAPFLCGVALFMIFKVLYVYVCVGVGLFVWRPFGAGVGSMLLVIAHGGRRKFFVFVFV